MASENQNLSALANSDRLSSAEGMKVTIVVADWNRKITGALLEGAKETLLRSGCSQSDINVMWVPGAFELPFGAKMAIEHHDIDGVIAIGCVIRGGTPHFDYVCAGTTQGIMDVQLSSGVPVAFGLLTVDDEQQAIDRCGGIHGNKGDEAAATLIEMIAIRKSL